MRRSGGISLASISLTSEVEVLVQRGTTTHEAKQRGISLASRGISLAKQRYLLAISLALAKRNIKRGTTTHEAKQRGISLASAVLIGTMTRVQCQFN